MPTLVDVAVPAEGFALRRALRDRPDARVVPVRTVLDGTERSMGLLWATDRSLDGLAEAVAADPTTASVDSLARSEEGILLRVAWRDDAVGLCRVVEEAGGVVLAARGAGESWTLQVLFSDHEALVAAHDVCDDRDIDLTVRRITDLSGVVRTDYDGLTEDQYESVRAAYERGYYDVPRGVTLEELAADLGVTHQALSERLRRGHARLVERALGPDPALPFGT